MTKRDLRSELNTLAESIPEDNCDLLAVKGILKATIASMFDNTEINLLSHVCVYSENQIKRLNAGNN